MIFKIVNIIECNANQTIIDNKIYIKKEPKSVTVMMM